MAVREVDGHNVDAVRSVLGALPVDPARPSAVVCHTVKGRGIPFAEGNPEWHHKSNISDEELAMIREHLV